jgi:hypothetical protein
MEKKTFLVIEEAQRERESKRERMKEIKIEFKIESSSIGAAATQQVSE